MLAALLLALLLAAAAYNRAQARRLLGSMPDEPPPSLLVAHHLGPAYPFGLAAPGAGPGPLQTTGLDMSQNPFGGAQQRHHLAGQQQQQQQPQQTSPQSLEGAGTPPTQPASYSSDMNSNLSGQSGNLIMRKTASLELGPANPAAGFYASLMAAVDQQHQTAAPSRRQQQQAHKTATAAAAAAARQRQRPNTLALVPLHLVAKLLALQLLLLVLIESQTILQQNVQLARRAFLQNSLLAPASLMAGPLADQQQQQQPPAPLNPVGLVTWLTVFAFYYLALSLLCWLLAQLIQLNGFLARKLAEAAGPLKRARASYPPGQMTGGSGAIYQAQNRYGQCQLLSGANGSAAAAAVNHQNRHQHQSGSSPTLSTFSSSLANELGPADHQRLYATNQRQQQQQQLFAAGHQKAGLEALYGARSCQHNGGAGSNSNNSNTTSNNTKTSNNTSTSTSNNNNGNNNNNRNLYAPDRSKYRPGRRWRQRLTRLATSPRLNWALINVGPLLLAGALVWLAQERAQALNQLAYTSTYASQLAYWPLLCFDVGLWLSASSVHLCWLPSVSVFLLLPPSCPPPSRHTHAHTRSAGPLSARMHN